MVKGRSSSWLNALFNYSDKAVSLTSKADVLSTWAGYYTHWSVNWGEGGVFRRIYEGHIILERALVEWLRLRYDLSLQMMVRTEQKLAPSR
jgi:hypothetical protein